jgi:hypothetical protein
MEEFSKSDVWEEVLKEKTPKIIKLFLDEGLLRKGELNEKMDAKFKGSDLKSLLKERNLPVTGKKSILIEKLLQSDREGMNNLLQNFDTIICTEKGKSIADDFLKKEEEIKNAVEQRTVHLLQKGKFYEARICIANYEAEQVFQRGIGIDWKNHKPNREEPILKVIFSKTPTMLKSLNQEQIDALRLAAGMMELWGTNTGKKWLPVNFSIPLQIDVDSAARMFLFYANFINSKKRYKDSNVEFVTIISSHDPCENCKKHSGKQYRIDQVMELPNPECTHKMGCRCDIVPIIEIDVPDTEDTGLSA